MHSGIGGMGCAEVGAMFATRSATFAAAFITVFTSAAFAVGCSGSSSSGDEPEATEGELGVEACSAPRVPTSLAGFEKMKTCQLEALFQSPAAKENTAAAAIPVGAFEGVPLCRKELLRTVRSSDIPPAVKALGIEAILKLLSVSDGFDNKVAGEIWHGKHFTPNAPGAELGFVNNYIDITDRGINDDTRRAAEADYFIDRKADRNWLVLDYKGASTGLRGLKHFSVELIHQVYDTARLVDKERGIWLGMAWMVQTPGEYSPETPKTVMPSCYFALQRRADQPAQDDKSAAATEPTQPPQSP